MAMHLVGRRVGQKAVCWTERKVARWVGSMAVSPAG